MATETDDIVVMINPLTGPFSHDPRWHDPAVRQHWLDTHDENGREIEVEEEDADEDDDLDYNKWTNDELRAELQERKLSVDGKKVELVARLEQDDAKAEA